ncbi:MAG: hypothetical protein IJY74_04085, partial [Oscillospiraceae bacterium]|nr:hypothetical protein [Oscillospiraceae bacterium]
MKKKRISAALCSVLLCTGIAQSFPVNANVGVMITETTFPDAAFRSHVSAKYDLNGDGHLLAEEIAAVTQITVNELGIADLTGIEHFTSLVTLQCGNNQLTSLNMSGNPLMETLSCYDNDLETLNITNNSALTYLDCGDNRLKTIDTSHNPALKYFDCGGGRVESIDVSNNPNLEHLYCEWNEINALDISANTKLKNLSCQANNITNLDFSSNTELEYICCANDLGTLDVSKNTKLVTLICPNSGLKTLDLSSNTLLTNLEINHNPLLSLNGVINTMETFDVETELFGANSAIVLSDYGIDPAMITNLSGASVTDGILVPDSL